MHKRKAGEDTGGIDQCPVRELTLKNGLSYGIFTTKTSQIAEKGRDFPINDVDKYNY